MTMDKWSLSFVFCLTVPDGTGILPALVASALLFLARSGKFVDMTADQILKELEELADRSGITIRY